MHGSEARFVISRVVIRQHGIRRVPQLGTQRPPPHQKRGAEREQQVDGTGVHGLAEDQNGPNSE
jgi:hypothetical protein